MTENVAQKKKTAVSRAEFDALESKVHDLEMSLGAARTQIQQILSVIFPQAPEQPTRQKFR